jgi:hypothetical protein
MILATTFSKPHVGKAAGLQLLYHITINKKDFLLHKPLTQRTTFLIDQPG